MFVLEHTGESTQLGTISMWILFEAMRLDGVTNENKGGKKGERGPRTMPWALHHGKGGEAEGPATDTGS